MCYYLASYSKLQSKLVSDALSFCGILRLELKYFQLIVFSCFSFE